MEMFVSFMLRPLCMYGRSSITLSIGGWVDIRAKLNLVAKRESLFFPGIEPEPFTLLSPEEQDVLHRGNFTFTSVASLLLKI